MKPVPGGAGFTNVDSLNPVLKPSAFFLQDNDSMKLLEWNFRKDAGYEFSEKPSIV
jgi:hypothetical protein